MCGFHIGDNQSSWIRWSWSIYDHTTWYIWSWFMIAEATKPMLRYNLFPDQCFDILWCLTPPLKNLVALQKCPSPNGPWHVTILARKSLAKWQPICSANQKVSYSKIMNNINIMNIYYCISLLLMYVISHWINSILYIYICMHDAVFRMIDLEIK